MNATAPPAFPEIGELVQISDGRSAALLGPDGAVEFFCPLRFDPPALVFPILDRVRGGRLRVGPVDSSGVRLSCRRHYQPASSILTLEWFGGSGSARMHMAMKWLPPEQEQEQEMLWLLHPRPVVRHPCLHGAGTLPTTKSLCSRPGRQGPSHRQIRTDTEEGADESADYG